MYSRVCLLCIIVTLSLGHVASKAGVEENDKIFSFNFDVIHPRDRNCELMSNQSKCEVELSAIVVDDELGDGEGVYEEPLTLGKSKLTYRMEIHIAKEKFYVVIDTGSNVLWVFGSECNKKDPACDGHPQYVVDTKVNHAEMTSSYMKGGRVTYSLVEDDIEISGKTKLQHALVIKKQIFGAAKKVELQYTDFDGILGLAIDPDDKEFSLMYTMHHEKLIKEASFSIYLNPKQEHVGEITFGGINEKLVDEKVEGVHTEIIETKAGEFIIDMASMKIGKESLCSKGKGACRVLVDSGASNIVLPTDLQEFIEKVLNKKPKSKRQVKCNRLQKGPIIKIKFDSKEITLEPHYYIDQVGDKCYHRFSFIDARDFNVIFGVPFFEKYYIQFNVTPKKEHISFWEKK